MKTVDSAKAQKLLLAIGTILIVGVLLGVILNSGGANTNKSKAFQVNLTINAKNIKGQPFSVSLRCTNSGASATGAIIGTPAEACNAAFQAAKILTMKDNCATATSPASAKITGVVNGQQLQGFVNPCSRAQFDKALPFLPVLAIAAQDRPVVSRNGLLLTRQGTSLIVELTQPTSPAIQKKILGQKVTVSCTTNQKTWSISLIWPRTATRIVVHPLGLLEVCQLFAKGQSLILGQYAS